MSGRRKYEIYMDGGCGFCQWTRARVEPFDTAQRLEWLDYNDAAVAGQAPFPREELAREIHVRTPEGKWYAGFEAWKVLLKAMPFLAWLGWIFSTRVFAERGPRLYAWVARNRQRLPGKPPPCRGDACEPDTGRKTGPRSQGSGV